MLSGRYALEEGVGIEAERGASTLDVALQPLSGRPVDRGEAELANESRDGREPLCEAREVAGLTLVPPEVEVTAGAVEQRKARENTG